MRCLIRRITRKTAAGDAYQDVVVETDALTIGRATNQHVFLSDLHVALQHAVIRPLMERHFSLQARSAIGVLVNGKLVQQTVIKAGDNMLLGRCRIEILTPPADYDLALEVEEQQAAFETAKRKRNPISLVETGLRKRPYAWLLFLATLTLTLILPLLHALYYDAESPPPWRGVLPGDTAWQAGALSRAHDFFGADCKACHRKPFESVRNGACLDCHAAQPAHSDTRQVLQASGLLDVRCATCHLEHNGNQGIVMAASGLCTNCHADASSMEIAAYPTRIHDFNSGHPEFRVALMQPDDRLGWRSVRTVRSEPTLAEDSGLIFPHDVHLHSEGVEGPEGPEPLACASCHEPETGNIAMRPFEMEKHCARCHRLDFELSEPERQVPHSSVQAVQDFLRDYYSRRALQGGYEGDDAPGVVRARRLPGQALPGEARQAALAWAETKATTVAQEIFARRVCTTCHEVTRNDANQEWDVAPVALTQDWFPAARFTHASHLTLQCKECHAAAASKVSADVLMPAIAQCRDCHGDAGANARIESDCVDCHKFHQARFILMGDAELDDETGLMYRD